MRDFVAAIDHGTTSTRFMMFDHDGNEIAKHQLEHQQILPRAGWVEHNPIEIWERTTAVAQTVLSTHRLDPEDLAALGITNQRETTVVWNRRTGRPYGNAIVWQDTRTAQLVHEREVDGVRADAERGDAIAGTIDSWLLWNLTGGPRGGVHVTDVTNASRTMLMDLETLDWDD